LATGCVKNNEMEEVTQMDIIDISGFYQVVLPYSEVVLVLVVAFFAISLTKKLIRRFLAKNRGLWSMVHGSDVCHT